MLSFIARKLLKQPIGTAVEITIETSSGTLETLRGTITDSDFETGMELTLDNGEAYFLDGSTVKSWGIRKDTEPGSPSEAEKQKEESLRRQKEEEQRLALEAARKKQEEEERERKKQSDPADAFFRENPDNRFNFSDGEMRQFLKAMPREDQALLNKYLDSFMAGISGKDRDKSRRAAENAVNTLLNQFDDGYVWSDEAALLCAGMMNRVQFFEKDVFLIVNRLAEAAFCCWKNKDYPLTAAYALLALLEEEPENVRDLLRLVYQGITLGGDGSGLELFLQAAPAALHPGLQDLFAGLFRFRDTACPESSSLPEQAAALKALYPGSAVEKKLLEWDILPEEEEEAPAAPAEPKIRENVLGRITHWDWSKKTGTIRDFYNEAYTFRPEELTDPLMRQQVATSMRSDLGGTVHHVRFTAVDNTAQKIQPDYAFVDRVQALLSESYAQSCPERFTLAWDLCKRALTTRDTRRAITRLVEVAVKLREQSPDTAPLKEALELYEQYRSFFSDHHFNLLNVAFCYCWQKKYGPMEELLDKAIACPDVVFKQRVPLTRHCLNLLMEAYGANGNRKLLQKMVDILESARENYAEDLAADGKNMKTFYQTLGPLAVKICCLLENADLAGEYLSLMPDKCAGRKEAEELLSALRKEQARQAREKAEAQRKAEEQLRREEEQALPPSQLLPELTEEAAVEEEIPPYTDPDGWPALKCSDQEVVSWALALRHGQKVPYMTAYLRAAANLNPALQPLYQNVALAAGDPMAAPDYSITSLLTALEQSDSRYPVLNDCCLAAAYLRASFQAGRGYDYASQSLRSSISLTSRLPVLQETYDLLEQFRKEVSVAVDIYADYRNHGLKRQKKEMAQLLQEAEALYTKYVTNSNAERTFKGRALQVQNLLFGKGSYLAQMLQHLVEQNTAVLEGEKEAFLQVWLKLPDTITPGQIDQRTVDKFVDNAWEQACKDMQVRKNDSFVGGPRSRTVGTVLEILSVLCRWYALTTQAAGLSWRTEQGEAVYQRIKPQLLARLAELEADCAAQQKLADDEAFTGMALLIATARELAARLEGSWKLHQEKYMYADFLRGSLITLNADFLPELEGTFCALPDFNILARLREHAEQEHPSFRDQLARIYGSDRVHNNYGTAARILEYLDFMEEAEELSLPENAELFHSQTEMQTQLLFESFTQRYGMALSYGQIIKSDAFSHTLPDTVRHWYAHCRTSRNYGFFAALLPRAESRVHEVARQQELQMEKELEALIARNAAYFARNPDVTEAIRDQISRQNFTVAEDWMGRIRKEDFSLEVQSPEALDYLSKFWQEFTDNYDAASINGRSLADSIQRRGVRNKGTRWAQQLIDSWITGGRSSNPDKVRQLLNLLGWQNIQVSAYPLPQDRNAEVYQVRRNLSTDGAVVPLHPIAAFGSALENRSMFVSCLYGVYTCDTLLEKFRTLNAMDGDKIILLDYTLSLPERRRLARKLKKRESGLRNTYIVIDRVLITYLANQFNPNLINRILMAVTMPFTYYQPYVVESTHTMPPEIFIGRTEELRQIESADGVNLIYGGRQLGKSALFKKAVSDLEGRGGKRAILIDINKLDCPAAARRISGKLIDMGILPEDSETDSWETLCRNLERMLRRNPEIPYFLLMLDEADTFISDCAAYDYRPLVALKDVQQSLPGRFKYVLAGLHDVVRFNRQVALGNNSVIPHIPYLKVTPFRTPEAQELLTVPLSYLGFSLPNKVIISQILATCNYFPGLIQLYARKLIESMRGPDYAGYDENRTPPYIVSDEHLRRVIADPDFNAQILEKFEGTLRLGEKDGNVYFPLTLLIAYLYYAAPSEEGYTARELSFHAKDLCIGALADLPEEVIDALLAELQELNILRSVSSNSYLLASKNFRDLLGSDEEIFEKLAMHGGNS